MKPQHWVRRLFPTSRRLLISKSLRRISPTSYRRVLIIGAGHDPYRDVIAQADHYVCLDIQKYDTIDVVADAHKLPFQDASFDGMLVTECLEHLFNPHLFIQEGLRVLAQGGTIILTVPFLYHQHADPFDFWRPTRKTLSQLFSCCQEIEIISQGNRIHVIWDLITTAFSPTPIFFPLRIFNHILVHLPGALHHSRDASTAPSGFMLIAKK